MVLVLLVCRSVSLCVSLSLEHTTTLFALSDQYILSREWRVIVDLVQSNYHGRPGILGIFRGKVGKKYIKLKISCVVHMGILNDL